MNEGGSVSPLEGEVTERGDEVKEGESGAGDEFSRMMEPFDQDEEERKAAVPHNLGVLGWAPRTSHQLATERQVPAPGATKW